MAIQDLLEDPDWDRPFFKRLPSNDTGAAPGHQGGMVIPKDLRRFFPGLVGRISRASPTIDRRIWADLYDGSEFLARVNTRYQLQSWSGARRPESRVTDNLADLRNVARPDDILIIQRNLLQLDLYRLMLVRRASSEFQAVDRLAGRARWGVLGEESPVTDDDFEEASDSQTEREQRPFALFDREASVVSSRAMRLARSMVFKRRIVAIYEEKCSVCLTGLQVPDGPIEIEAAHIVPRGVFGSDDARNGLALCRRHHWAFDRGLFGVDKSRLVYIPQRARLLRQNQPLDQYAGKPISEATEPSLRAANEALSWHMEHVVLK